MSEVINNSGSLFWLQHCCHRRSGKRHHTSVCYKRMFAWLTINTMLRVPYRTDSDTDSKIIKRQCNPLDSFQNNPRNQVSATLGNHANTVTVCVPRNITQPELLPSEWAAVMLSSGAEVEPKRFSSPDVKRTNFLSILCSNCEF